MHFVTLAAHYLENKSRTYILPTLNSLQKLHYQFTLYIHPVIVFSVFIPALLSYKLGHINAIYLHYYSILVIL